MALLVMPAVAMNFLYVLIFTILLSPNVSDRVFTTQASANAINLADEVVSPGIPFLIAIALVVIGLKHMIWKHSTSCKFHVASNNEDALTVSRPSHGGICADE